MKYAIAILAVSAGPALAECPAPETIYAAAEGWLAGERLPDPGVENMEDAACAYTHWRERLEDEYGRPVGVKVGFTSAPAQERFGVDGPVAGALFRPMLLENGAEISLNGSRTPFFEADLVVTVADPEALAAATTREEAAAALGAVQAFIELPDMALAEGVQPNGAIMASYGVIPWRGVLGESLPLAELADPVDELGALTATLSANGEEMDRASGEALLGHPLDVVLWLAGQGNYDLSEGSVISLGSLGALHPAEPGLEIRADYQIGDKALSVTAVTVE
ncbi:hydratase [Paracoccus sediminicola]|uniref:hydratase n=1 Tax=Paracoccus sediminicola TaxID=3017783 RepID=UPI0022F0F8AA|nr:hydratase [Paracoccus sediminicola]WBU56613.1 hydratase [Paracoccus sediminicola]